MKKPLQWVLVMMSAPLLAQQPKAESAGPRTKLEAFGRQSGTVIIRGFTHVGRIVSSYGGFISVESREFTDATTGKKEYGIIVEVTEGDRLAREERSYVDYDEIDGLLKG